MSSRKILQVQQLRVCLAGIDQARWFLVGSLLVPADGVVLRGGTGSLSRNELAEATGRAVLTFDKSRRVTDGFDLILGVVRSLFRKN